MGNCRYRLQQTRPAKHSTHLQSDSRRYRRVRNGCVRQGRSATGHRDGQLRCGPVVHSHSVRAYTGESQIADALSALQDAFAEVDIGSYPFFRGKMGNCRYRLQQTRPAKHSAHLQSDSRRYRRVRNGCVRQGRSATGHRDGQLRCGPVVHSHSVRAYTGESQIADALSALQDEFAEVDIGSYPFFRDERYGTILVIRGTDTAQLADVAGHIMAAVEALGETPEDMGLTE